MKISKVKPVGSDLNKYGAGRSVLIILSNVVLGVRKGLQVKVGIVKNYYHYF